MATGELFRQNVAHEGRHEREVSVPDEYVRTLFAHVETIPDISQLPSYYYTSPEDNEVIGRYCASNYKSSQRGVRPPDELLVQHGITPLLRMDIIEPDFCGTVSSLLGKVSGNSHYWYRPVRTNSGHEPYQDRTEQHNCRKWELTYIDYMRQRRLFHAQFMKAMVDQQPIEEQVADIGLKDGQAVQVPGTRMSYDTTPPPDFMYNPSSWVTSGMLSALALPPGVCPPNMKRHAIEEWAKHVDLSDENGFAGFHGLEETPGPVQLPWSMRSNSDMRAAHHPQWRENSVIQSYLGPLHDERADGLKSLLLDRPKDYIQVLILKTFSYSYYAKDGLKHLLEAAQLPEEVKDIIFGENASFNTIYSDGDFPDPDQATTLVDLLNTNGDMPARTQEDIIETQQLRIHVLTEKVAAAEARAKAAEASLGDVQALQRAYNEVSAHNQELQAQLQQQNRHVPTSQADVLMLKYNISPAMGEDPEILRSVIRTIRKAQARKYHSDANEEYKTNSPLGEINNELDEILRSNGIQP